MKIAAFLDRGRPGVGIVSSDLLAVLPLDLPEAEAARGALPVIERLAAGGTLPATGAPIALDAVQLTAPLPRPRRQIFRLGQNERAPRSEVVIGPQDTIALPAASTAIAQGADLAVVIGRGGRGILRADALAHVWGYAVLHDVSAGDGQGWCPMGPWLVSAEQCEGTRTRVRCWVNDELRQDASTSELAVDIPTLVERLSASIELHPGDIIAAGTPGVGTSLRAGDVVRSEIDGVGALENPVR